MVATCDPVKIDHPVREMPLGLSIDFNLQGKCIGGFIMKMNMLYSATFLVLLLAISGAATSSLQAQQLPAEVLAYADMVLYNGKILTVDERFSIEQAVAIRDGKFLAVGDNDRILAMAGPESRKIDLQGKSVTPGLMPTHQHGWGVGGQGKGGLGGNVYFKDIETGLEEVRKIVEVTPPGEWVFLSGVRNIPFLEELTRQDLDRVSPNNPVALHGSTAETVINTAAMKAAGIKPGMVGVLLDEKGEPTGQLRQAAVGIITYEMKPERWPDLQTLASELKDRMLRRAAAGMTTQIGRASGLTISVLRELWDRGELPIRARVSHEFLMYNPNAEAYLRRVGNLRNFGDDWMKIFGATVGPVDGVVASGGVMSTRPKIQSADVLGGDVFGPYGQNKWAQLDTLWEENFEEFSTERKAVILANRYGWNLTSLHSNGDLSAEVYLDAFEEANREKPLEGPWSIDHNWTSNPDVLARMQKLGSVIPSVKPYRMFTNPERLLHQYGADRLQENTVMLQSMIRAGLMPTPDTIGGEGTGVEGRPGRPFSGGLQGFITRTDEQGRRWNPKEAINRNDALRMYTIWAARYTDDQDKLGSIEPGKLADLVVLDGDYMRVPDDQLSELEVTMTIVGGKVVYDLQRDGVIQQRVRGTGE